jgi:hypothetical protein
LDIRIDPPLLTPAAQKYAWEQIAARAGFDARQIPLNYGGAESPAPSTIIDRSSPADWVNLLTLLPQDMTWIPAQETIPTGATLPFSNSVPVLFWGAKAGKTAGTFAKKLQNGSVVFHADILAATLFMLTRWEEIALPQRDAHGRFPAVASTAYRLGFLDTPIVDQYALILREWLKTLIPNWKPNKNIPSVRLTHDIDFISQYPTPLTFARAFKTALLSKQPPVNIRRVAERLKIQFTSPEKGERYLAIFQLAEISKSHGFKSHFYFMAAKPGFKQEGYDPALPYLKKAYRFLAKEGHEIGLHPGYSTFENLQTLQTEKERLERALDSKVAGSRQHFLRFRAPYTWRHLEQAGLEYDSTMGFADYEGFRCGTSHPYHPYDMELDQEMKILEVPLIVMDTTLRHNRRLSPEQGKLKILDLADKCSAVEGTFTILWHNTSLVDDWEDWTVMYCDVLSQLSKIQDTMGG